MTAPTFKRGDRVRVTGNRPAMARYYIAAGEVGEVANVIDHESGVVVDAYWPRGTRLVDGTQLDYDNSLIGVYADDLELVAVADLPTSLPELQAAVGAWHRERWGIADRIMMAAKLAEEVGEVCEAAVKQAQGHPDAAGLDYGAELGDVVIVALAAADLAGVDLTDKVLAKLTRLGAIGHREIASDR